MPEEEIKPSMTSPSGRNTNADCLYASKLGDTYFIRVAGLGNLRLAQALHEFLEETFGKETVFRLVFDLGMCRGLDSTFMGVMVGTASRLREAGAEDDDDWFDNGDEEVSATGEADGGDAFGRAGVFLINVGDTCRHCLKTVGASFFMSQQAPCDLEGLEYSLLALPSLPPVERGNLIRKAHDNLIRADERNREKFGGLVEMLNLEIERLNSGRETG